MDILSSGFIDACIVASREVVQRVESKERSTYRFSPADFDPQSALYRLLTVPTSGSAVTYEEEVQLIEDAYREIGLPGDLALECERLLRLWMCAWGHKRYDVAFRCCAESVTLMEKQYVNSQGEDRLVHAAGIGVLIGAGVFPLWPAIRAECNAVKERAGAQAQFVRLGPLSEIEFGPLANLRKTAAASLSAANDVAVAFDRVGGLALNGRPGWFTRILYVLWGVLEPTCEYIGSDITDEGFDERCRVSMGMVLGVRLAASFKTLVSWIDSMMAGGGSMTPLPIPESYAGIRKLMCGFRRCLRDCLDVSGASSISREDLLMDLRRNADFFRLLEREVSIEGYL